VAHGSCIPAEGPEPERRMRQRQGAPATAPAILILNGKDGLDDDLVELVARWREGSPPLEVRVTRASGDAARFAREAADAGAPTVVAGGGDGTIHDVVAGLLSGAADAPRRIPTLGILPLGTANDFAEMLEVPKDLDGALSLALHGESFAVDVGWVDDQPVVNMATGGFGTDVTPETPEGLKEKLGRLSYLITGISRIGSFRTEPVLVRTESEVWEGEVVALAIGNGVRAGGAVQFCPDARIDDGLLDLTIVPGEGEGALDALAMLLETGGDWLSRAVRLRSPWIEVDAPGKLAWSVDGEPFRAARPRFEARPGALRLRAPRGSPLLGGGGG